MYLTINIFQQKWKRRNVAFKKNKDLFLEYGTEKECQEFLEKVYMSEEEPCEFNEQGQIISFKKSVPRWRSENVGY